MNRDKKCIIKSEFVDRYSQINGITKKQAGIEVENFLTAMYRTLAGGNGVKLQGFGQFNLKYRKATTNKMNFGKSAGEIAVVPEHYSLTFTPCEALKADVNSITVE